MNKNRLASLTALGRESLPSEIQVEGHGYAKRLVFKNDFFAITALYEGDAGKVVLKIHRRARFLVLPGRWLGRWLAHRELAAFELLRDVDEVPDAIGRWGKTGLIRRFVEGHALTRGEHVPDDFHERLRALIATMHERGMAYVDLEKSENVLVGDDGRPHLIDFQIAWILPKKWGGELWPMRCFRTWLQVGDRYHLQKLRRRTRPDQLSSEELANSYRRPWTVRLHRFLTLPFTWCRRRILDRLAPRHGSGERGRISD